MDKIGRYHSIHRAVVTENKDPSNLRRIKVYVPQVSGGPEVNALSKIESNWVWPIISTKRPPKIGQGVFIFYIGGDPEFPVWIGEYGEPANIQGVFCYGSWFSSVDQSAAANTPTAMTVNNTDYSEGIKVVDGSKFKVEFDATYNLQFSAQFHHTGGGGNGNTVDVWFRKNGVNIPNSNTKVTVQSNNPYVVAAWNFVSKLKKDDYLQIYWATDNANIIMEYEAAGSYPAIPSLITTMTQIA